MNNELGELLKYYQSIYICDIFPMLPSILLPNLVDLQALDRCHRLQDSSISEFSVERATTIFLLLLRFGDLGFHCGFGGLGFIDEIIIFMLLWLEVLKGINECVELRQCIE
jgi:hypothetical protein